MHCDEFIERLQTALDRRASWRDDETLVNHAQQCPQCQNLTQAWRDVEIGLAASAFPKLPVDFAQQTVRRLPAASRRSLSPELTWVAVAIAAGLLLAVGIGFRPGQEVRPAGSGDPLASQGLPGDPDPRLADRAPAIEDRSLEPAPASLASSDEYRRLFQALWARLPEPPLEDLESVDQIALGIRPIAVTLNAALVALRRSLPGGDAGESRKRGDSARAFTGFSDRVRV